MVAAISVVKSIVVLLLLLCLVCYCRRFQLLKFVTPITIKKPNKIALFCTYICRARWGLLWRFFLPAEIDKHVCIMYNVSMKHERNE